MAEKTILERAHLISQPKITFGLNIRDPMQLLLYEKLVQFIRVQAKEIAETSVREHAVSIREDLMMQEWIKQFGLLRKICWQAANEAIMESVD